MMKTAKRTPRQVVDATAKYYGIHPDRIRKAKKLDANDYMAKVPQAMTMAQGLARALGNPASIVMEEIPRKNKSSVNKAHEKLEWNVRADAKWRKDAETILQMMN